MTYARNRAIGQFGEGVAVRHLRSVGVVVLDRNWSCAVGEIDIVARDGATLVVCEVKTRSSNRFGGPFEAITDAKAERLRKLADEWANAHGITPKAIRIDVISVVVPARGAPVVERLAGVA